jgi:DNA transformation protein
MQGIKGYRLLVNLSASQVRKRLKGFGFGVRKVQSAGRGQSLLIHTATGQHRQELYSIFQDVIAPIADVEEDASGEPQQE